jgi:hypothetical protein
LLIPRLVTWYQSRLRLGFLKSPSRRRRSFLAAVAVFLPLLSQPFLQPSTSLPATVAVADFFFFHCRRGRRSVLPPPSRFLPSAVKAARAPGAAHSPDSATAAPTLLCSDARSPAGSSSPLCAPRARQIRLTATPLLRPCALARLLCSSAGDVADPSPAQIRPSSPVQIRPSSAAVLCTNPVQIRPTSACCPLHQRGHLAQI